MEKLRVVFMGTPDFAVPALEALIKSDHEVVGVFTQPPRPKGRGKQVQPSPIDHVASTHQIPVFIPKSLRKDEAARQQFFDLKPDVAVVAAYGLLLPKEILEFPRFGCLNVHASLLPRWRGASPIQHSIWAGDKETGVCIMKMTEGLDEGAYISRDAIPIKDSDMAQDIHDKLSIIGAKASSDILDRLASGEVISETVQDDSKMTYAPLLKKEDGRVDWNKSAIEITRQVRALTPWPGVWTMTDDGKRLKILNANVADINEGTMARGTIIDREGHVVCADGSVICLKTIQPENAKRMDAVSAVNGNYIKIGQVLGA